MRIFESLGWLEHHENDLYTLTEDAYLIEHIPNDIESLYSLEIDSLSFKQEPLHPWHVLLGRSLKGWDGAETWMCHFLDGCLAIPLLSVLEHLTIEMPR